MRCLAPDQLSRQDSERAEFILRKLSTYKESLVLSISKKRVS